MKSNYTILTVLIAVLTLTVYTSPLQAEETITDASVQTVGVSASSTVQVDTPTKKPLPVIKTLRDRVQQVKENAIQRQEDRNVRLDERKDIMQDKRESIQDIRNQASSTIRILREEKGGRDNSIKKMRKEILLVRKDSHVKQLELSLKNLDSISSRISSRITKVESDGRDMSEAKTLLGTARTKLEKARADVALFASWVPTAPTNASTATTTLEVDLAKPRALADAATKSVRDAREAFKLVVQSIAHNMGLGDDRRGTSTTPTATSTATTTIN